VRRYAMKQLPDGLCVTDAKFLPIIAAYVKELGIVETVNRMCPNAEECDVSPGHMVAAMILDTLIGRSPLYRLESSFENLDIELLLGIPIGAEKLNDDAAGRALDRIGRAGTGKIYGAAALTAVSLWGVNTRHVSEDTTSRITYGDYDPVDDPKDDRPFEITHGFSKQKRPDLKQIVHSMLCVDHGIPIYMKTESGNASDMKINENILKWVVDSMRTFGERDMLYVGDSVLVTEPNLDLMADPKTGCRFVTRLPSRFKECKEAIARAVDANEWQDLGPFSDEPETPKRKPARYRIFETVVTLYGRVYRAPVVHSDAHDRRKTHALESRIKDDEASMTKLQVAEHKIKYACRPDAEAALTRLPEGTFHRLTGEIEERAHYKRGRRKADGTSQPTHITYHLKLKVTPKVEVIERAEKETGCFVLLSNAPKDGSGGMSARELLAAYKDQHYIERNFGFLKDPVIVNSLFLKTARRIEALGLILVLSLLVWRLVERTMRASLKAEGGTVKGWVKRQTQRPTSFMMTIVFLSMMVVRTVGGRYLAKPLTRTQEDYLRILRVSPAVFTDPCAGMEPAMPGSLSYPEDPG
jgi:transposase